MAKMSVTEALKAIGVELPGGWENWPLNRQHKFFENQKKRIIAKRRMVKLTQHRAERETFRGGPMTFTPREGANPEDPTFIIRGVYGPLAGLNRSMIAVKLKDGKDRDSAEFVRPHFGDGAKMMVFEEDRIVKHMEDNPRHPWGPREFIYNLLNLAAQYGGDCELYLTHNKLEIGLDPVAFEEWVRRSTEDPVGMLLDGQKLLETKG